ncbi:unnamed protein product [Chrysodeixis includens]|uniref:Uncharacterized protein n=1 Tax=Chrysodeixis includens TaxID=689277 RepID=A0A9P0BST7_CHRIL|nr:unnamed protein product [Chrysodeixis includens]
MKTFLILSGLFALAMGSALPGHQNIKTKNVDASFIEYQKKILALFEHSEQLDVHSEYYKVGKEYSIEDHIDNYVNKKAVEEFLMLYRTGFLPKYHKFSIFYERMRNEAIALFHVFYYAKDFETFYKAASWAKVHLNEEQFLYAYYIALVQRSDTNGIVLPAPYEVYPQFFFNQETLMRMYRTKMQGGLLDEKYAAQYGIQKEHDYYVVYSNYSNSLSYPNEEYKMSYFTEDIGLNSYYYYFHSSLPFWWHSDKLGMYKERLGEMFVYYYQKLLARYYLERLSNGLGEVPKFSWYSQFKTGYYPQLTGNYLPFVQRSNDYDIHTERNYEYIRFLDTYEKTFFQFLQKGEFEDFEKEINNIGNYFHMNTTKDLHQFSYEIIARQVLGGSPKPVDKYSFMPSALDFYQTSLRDPAFYQLYQRIIDYLIDYKEYVKPYSYNDLHFVGVKIDDVKVDKLVTYFDYFDFNATNSVFYSQEELKAYPTSFVIRQPRLNHEPFSVNIDVKSDVASDAVFKIFIGPKYDSNGYPVKMEEDWMKFYELDWFVQKLVPGENKVQRKSSDFMFFKDDSIPINEIYQWLDQGKVPFDMSYAPSNMPRRLMLPKGTYGGYPFQMFVFVYPLNGVNKETDVFKHFVNDNKPFGYPFDRPVNDYAYFKQPNMYFEDVEIYHKDEYFPYEFNVPSYFMQKKF